MGRIGSGGADAAAARAKGGEVAGHGRRQPAGRKGDEREKTPPVPRKRGGRRGGRAGARPGRPGQASRAGGGARQRSAQQERWGDGQEGKRRHSMSEGKRRHRAPTLRARQFKRHAAGAGHGYGMPKEPYFYQPNAERAILLPTRHHRRLTLNHSKDSNEPLERFQQTTGKIFQTQEDGCFFLCQTLCIFCMNFVYVCTKIWAPCSGQSATIN